VQAANVMQNAGCKLYWQSILVETLIRRTQIPINGRVTEALGCCTLHNQTHEEVRSLTNSLQDDLENVATPGSEASCNQASSTLSGTKIYFFVPGIGP